MILTAAAVDGSMRESTVHGVVLGLIYGLIHVVGPDHLGVLITLSSAASTPRGAAFLAGAWALGHSIGMIVVAVFFVVVGKVGHLEIERYEHWGDYVIGASLLLCAAYFIARESEYTRKNDDDSYSLANCECCPVPVAGSDTRTPEPRRRGRNVRFSIPPACCEDGNCGNAEHDHEIDKEKEKAKKAASEQTPLLAGDEAAESFWIGYMRYVKGAVFGVVQGLCCPMGLLGVTFVTALQPAGVIAFTVIFLLCSILGTAVLAAMWSAFIGVSTHGSVLTPLRMYRASCAVTLALGLFWIIANACGVLDRLNYSHSMHDDMHTMHGGSTAVFVMDAKNDSQHVVHGS